MEAKWPRRIAHLDMDAFYASVELLRYPQLRGQPLVIGGQSEKCSVSLEDGIPRFFCGCEIMLAEA